MGKRLIQQRRGRNKTKFNSPSHIFKGKVKYDHDLESKKEGIVVDLIHDSGHTAPIAEIQFKDKSKTLIIAPEGIKVGDKVNYASKKDGLKIGNIQKVGDIAEGTPIFNVELSPGDGGKLVRSGGNSATVVSHNKAKTVIQLPSGRFKTIESGCRASIGTSAGGGRKDKPFLKAGKKHHSMRTRGKQYPVVRGVAMCAVSHPHGGGGHQHVGKPYTVKRGASPGRKVGSIAAKRTGRK
jgi:large subunit ribosomal protein L2